MKCKDNLVLLLGAEREELEGRGTSALAMHVRECARCGAVAARLVADTRVLAAEVAARPARAHMRRISAAPLIWGGSFVGAAVLALLMIPAHAVPVAQPVHVPVAARASAEPTPQPRPEDRIQATRYADAIAATPVRFVTSQISEQRISASDFGGVSVAPPSGVRSTVLATRNAKITVVWLY
jgi:hypothetical protein